MTRSALLVAHTGRRQITELAGHAARQLVDAGFEVRMLAEEAADCVDAPVRVVADGASTEHRGAADGAEIVLVLGGDGTFLRAAELARPAGVPMLGVNLGHVGFLAEADPDHLDSVLRAIIECSYEVEDRVTLDVEVQRTGQPVTHAWALNEASLERGSRARILEVAVSVDERPLLRFGCDGVLCSTPTGSTAYAFSAGGPIVWPNVDALVVVPNAAHALFARPIVVDPASVVDIDLLRTEYAAVLSCDGRRTVELAPRTRLRVRKGDLPVRIARRSDWSFAERLVDKFQLPVESFRDAGPAERRDQDG